jgi:hypothetical protein
MNEEQKPEMSFGILPRGISAKDAARILQEWAASKRLD